MRFKAKYEVENGYFSESAPHYFYIDEDMIHDETEEEYLIGVLHEAMQEDFEMKVYPIETCKEEYLDWCRAVIEKRNTN